MSSLLYGVSASDPLVFPASALSLFAIALAAAYVPARAPRADRTRHLTNARIRAVRS
jgi:hypothetical protein